MNVRDAIAAAASTVVGVNVQPYYTQTTKPGTGCVRRDATTYPNRLAGVVTWSVVVVLPSDLRAADEWMDEHVPQLVAALAREMTVKTATPVVMPFDATGVPAVLIEGTREEES